MKDKQLSVKQESSVVMFDAEDESQFSGALNVRSELIKPPTLKLGQAMSPDVQAGLAKIGEFYSKAKGRSYGKEITIIPLIVNESAALLDDAGNLVCKSLNLLQNQDGELCSKCPHNSYWAKWGVNADNGKKIPPKCKNGIDIALLVETENGIDRKPMIFTFRKDNFKPGKELLDSIVNHPRGIPFAKKYKIKSKAKTNDRNQTYYIADSAYESTGITQEEYNVIKPIGLALLKQFKEGLVDITETEKEGETHAETAFEEMPL